MGEEMSNQELCIQDDILRQLRLKKLVKEQNGTIRKMTLVDLKKVLKNKYDLDISLSYLSLIERGIRQITNSTIIEAFESLYQIPKEKLFSFYHGKEIIEQISNLI